MNSDKEFVLSVCPTATAHQSKERFDRGWYVSGKCDNGIAVHGHGGIAAQAWSKAARYIRSQQASRAKHEAATPYVLNGINAIAAQHGVDPSTVRSIIAAALALGRSGPCTAHDIEKIVEQN